MLSKFRYTVCGFSPASVLLALFFFIYACFFYSDLSPFWFNPDWTTDDALQQVYQFHSVFKPQIFEGDFITETMRGYLAPLHYWLCAGMTWLTGNPIQMAHWMTLVQLAAVLIFLFLAVRQAAGTPAAFFAATWFLHTRLAVQRLTGGLPRGWAAVVIAALLYFLVRRSHKGVLLTLLLGCLLHPPATLIAAMAYGFFLLFQMVRRESRPSAVRALLVLLCLSPLYAGLTYSIVRRPPEVGQMVDYQTAVSQPEFQKPDGRFPFTPLNTVAEDLRWYAFNPFVSRLYNPCRGVQQVYSWATGRELAAGVCPGEALRRWTPWVAAITLALLCLLGWRRRRTAVPVELWSLLLGIFTVYFAARILAFRLYVPDRHVHLPMAVFWIAAFTIALWHVFRSEAAHSRSGAPRSWPAVFALFLFGAAVWFISGTGLDGSANFNYSRYHRGKVFEWIRKNTAADALIAGHPTQIDGVQLFGVRKAFVTTEVAHPFYQNYYREMDRRMQLSLRAHYAQDYEEFLRPLEAEGIDYFVFSLRRFAPGAPQCVRLYQPLNQQLQTLCAQPAESYVLNKLLALPQPARKRVGPFKDDEALLVSVRELRAYLTGTGRP